MLKTVSMTEEYVRAFEALSPEKAEVLRFHGDVIPGGAAAVVRTEEGTLDETFLGAGFLQEGPSYHARERCPRLPFYNIHMDFAVDYADPEAVPAAEMLLQELIARCAVLKEEAPERTLALTYWVRSEARETRTFLESFGFRKVYRMYHMVREIGGEGARQTGMTSADVTSAENAPVIAEADLLDPAAMKDYIDATEESYGVPDSEEEMRFRILRQGARIFTIEGKTFVTVWDLGNGCAVTENIFTRKAFRRQGFAKRLLMGVTERLCAEGFERLSLNVYPEYALSALRMYRALGFETVRETDEEYIMVHRLVE